MYVYIYIYIYYVNHEEKTIHFKKYFGYCVYQLFLYANYFHKIVAHEITVLRPTIITTIHI